MNAEKLLKPYREKRDFTRTAEPPPGKADESAGDLVFVVQQHAATQMHWDFRLEVNGVLKSWPLPKGPSLDPAERRMAVMVEDHPYDYRTFEGVIPKGEYGGGQVIVWDEGTYTPDEGGVFSWGDREEGSARMREGIEAGKLSFTLRGHKLKGSFTLVKTRYAKNSWLMIKHRDEYATSRDVLQEDRSVRSGLTIRDLKEGRLPGAAPVE
jgi:bifunctional non-homologous end joining protein LigD